MTHYKTDKTNLVPQKHGSQGRDLWQIRKLLESSLNPLIIWQKWWQPSTIKAITNLICCKTWQLLYPNIRDAKPLYTLCIPETPWVLYRTGKTQMKCHTMCYFIRVCTVCYDKNHIQRKERKYFGQIITYTAKNKYNLTPIWWQLNFPPILVLPFNGFKNMFCLIVLIGRITTIITSRDVELKLFSRKLSVSLDQKGLQLSCHLFWY